LAEARLAGEALPWTAGPPLDAACTQLAADLGVRLTVIAADGRVLGESTRSSESLENHADRPEVKDALANGHGQKVRHSATLGVRLLYTAWRQTHGDAVRVVRTALPLTAVAENVAHLRRLLAIGLFAAMLLGLATSLVLSRRVLRRIQRLVAFSRAVAGGETVVSRDLTLEGAERTTLQVNGALLCGPDGQPFGYVLVLHDVTELRRLEVVRRDFVANVSHELRTPLTAIKGYAETL